MPFLATLCFPNASSYVSTVLCCHVYIEIKGCCKLQTPVSGLLPRACRERERESTSTFFPRLSFLLPPTTPPITIGAATSRVTEEVGHHHGDREENSIGRSHGGAVAADDHGPTATSGRPLLTADSETATRPPVSVLPCQATAARQRWAREAEAEHTRRKTSDWEAEVVLPSAGVRLYCPRRREGRCVLPPHRHCWVRQTTRAADGRYSLDLRHSSDEKRARGSGRPSKAERPTGRHSGQQGAAARAAGHRDPAPEPSYTDACPHRLAG